MNPGRKQNVYKKTSIAVIIFLLVLSLHHIAVTADMPPFPGLPHGFWGTAKTTNGQNVPDGAIITAIVDNETYHTTVMNCFYGFNETYQSTHPPFFVEDPENDNSGKTIVFYIGEIKVPQSMTFINGGETRLDLTVDMGGNTGNGGNGGAGGNHGGGTNNTHQKPHADAGGLYFGAMNRTLLFNASKSNDSDGKIISYTWSFGDGTTGNGKLVTHIYKKAGVYTLILTVTDNHSLVDNDSTLVSITNDSDGDGWSDDEEKTYGTNATDPHDYPIDSDGDMIPNIIDPDDDNDGLTDIEEKRLGSDPLNSADVVKIIYNNITFFFVDINKDGQPDKYFNTTSGLNTTLQKGETSGSYYVDTNNDGTFEYIYYSTENSVVTNNKVPTTGIAYSSFYLIFIVIIILVVLFLVVYKKKLRGNKP